VRLSAAQFSFTFVTTSVLDQNILLTILFSIILKLCETSSSYGVWMIMVSWVLTPCCFTGWCQRFLWLAHNLSLPSSNPIWSLQFPALSLQAWRWRQYISPISIYLRKYTSPKPQTSSLSPNVVVKWLTLLLHIQEVPGWNLGPETAYLDWSFSYFFSVLPGEFRDSTLKIRPRPLPTKSLPIQHSSVTLPFDAV
jgi:hypothetical protein